MRQAPNTVSGVHRAVARPGRDLFWGISGATRVELATPSAAAWIFGCTAGQQVCNDFGGSTRFGASRPHNTLGYKDIDVQLSKDITFVGSLAGYVRVDVINVFNWHNFNPGDIAVNGDTLRATYNKQGNIVGSPRTVRLTAGLRF